MSGLAERCSSAGRLPEQVPQIWEFPVADFLVCARPDVHGLYVLSPTARVLWEAVQAEYRLEQAAEIFVQALGISAKQALEDVSRMWGEWSMGLLAPFSIAAQDANPEIEKGSRALAFLADYCVFGKVIRLRLYDADVAWDLTPRVEPFRIATSNGGVDETGAPDAEIEVFAGDEAFHIFVNGIPVSSEAAVYSARVSVLQEFLKASSPVNWAAVLHAGACGSSSDCVLFPGASHSGKTTLAAALVHEGMTFYGDDSIPLAAETIGEALRVEPMPFALMTREGSWPVLSTLFPGLDHAPVVDRWGEKVRYLTAPRPDKRHSPSVSAVVFTRYVAGGPTELRSLSAFDGLQRLIESGFWLEHSEASIRSFLTWFESVSRYCLVYSDLTEAVGVIRNLIPDSSASEAGHHVR